MRIEDVHFSEEEFEAFRKQNFEDRLAWVSFKVKWMREHGQIVD